MRIVLAPDSFKESISARAACAAIARGIRQVRPEAIIDAIPMADGGEGTVEALIAATGGTLRQTTVTGPLGEPVLATWGLLGGSGPAGGTAVIEMAAASGLGLVPPDRRDALAASTGGTGQLILAALDAGAERIIVGVGGSATTDGGAGAAQAAGVAFLDQTGRPLPVGLGGGGLDRVTRIDLRPRDPRIARDLITAACDVQNPLFGPNGSIAIFAPQKGATPEQVALLERNLAHLADLIHRDLGREVRALPGGGAAGGLGAGLGAFFEARLQPGIELVMEAAGFRRRITGADLVITGEGRLDRQSMMGKVVGAVGQAARAAGVPAIALVGAVGEGADAAREVLDSYTVINPPGSSPADALAHAAERLQAAAAAVLSQWKPR